MHRKKCFRRRVGLLDILTRRGLLLVPYKAPILGDCRGSEYPMYCSVMIRLVFVEFSMMVLSRKVDVALMSLIGVVGIRLVGCFSACHCLLVVMNLL